jgi:hypothetical protein
VLGGDGDGGVAVELQQLGDLGAGALDVGGGEIDLVDDGTISRPPSSAR